MPNEFTAESLPAAIRLLFQLNNYDVEGPVQLRGAEVDLVARPKSDPFGTPIYIEATIEHVDNEKYGKDAGKFALIREIDPGARRLIVSARSFSLPVKERAKDSRIETLTYDELFAKFERFDPYIKNVLSTGPSARQLRDLDAVYEEPSFFDKVGNEQATNFLSKWRSTTALEKRWLVIVGEYGTGKTALTKILQYRWTQEYQKNPSLPIPFRIELREFTRQFDARGLLHHFLDHNGLGHVPLDFVFTLIRAGRIVLLLDGYDEMAQYMHARERRVCLEALAQLASDGAKGILTSRPNYFSEAEELQVFEILYSSLNTGSFYLTGIDKDVVAREKELDQLLLSQFLERYERTLKDLSPEQTESLVKRVLKNDNEGRDAVLNLLGRIQRSSEDAGAISLSGKPVIISYLLDVVESLKEHPRGGGDAPLSEWAVYRLIVEQLMMRDFRRSHHVLPAKRRSFLRNLSVWLSKRDNPIIGEEEFQSLIRREFKAELRLTQSDREEEVQKYYTDLRSSATLTRSSDPTRTGFRFSHNSLREFLLTEYLLDCLEKDELAPEQVPVSDPMRVFTASRDSKDIEHLFSKLTARWAHRENQPGIGQILSLLWDGALRLFATSPEPVRECLTSLAGGNLRMDTISVSRLKLSSENRPSTLNGIDFSASTLSDVDFSSCVAAGSNFSNAILENTNFSNASLLGARFNDSLLIDVDFTGTILVGADFRGADKSSTILVDPVSTTPRRLEGLASIGYLNFAGATTDEVPSYYVFQNHPGFPIIEKICRKLTEGARQKRGLEQRGAARQNPKFASQFIKYLENTGLVEPSKGRTEQVVATERGRDVFTLLFERRELSNELANFLRDNRLV
ncbi:NACHT domain-containing protein [Corallococcus sp. AS-1-6]|uniref:NACHT domain-containing protein n=1 Tax=Corallococcus sp. AS-1-6 TaxID=2874599 RepID=UPI001CBEC006|nr:NACHT domain-containing protein [Corallococcus sp. AS-1-6]MBZ4372618.1 NACHT domain-containing protein [Corallococcus sp. AS-1-6]